MSDDSRAPTPGTVASAKQPRSAWRKLLGVGAAALGFYLTVTMAVRVIHRAEGYDPGDADCDDCGLTLVLDNIGWLAAAVVGYLGVLLLAWWLLHRRCRPRLA